MIQISKPFNKAKMKEDFKNIEQIEAWLEGKLNEAERIDFEKRMQDDPVFVKEIEFLKDVLTGIKLTGEERIRSDARKIEKELEEENFFNSQTKIVAMTNNTKTSSSKRWLAIAASLVVLVAAAAYFLREQPSPTDPAAAFAEYYKPEKAKLPAILDRLEASGLADENKTKDDSLAQALDLYHQDKYAESKSALSGYLEVYPDDQLAHMYMGLAQLQLTEYAKASTHLTPLLKAENFEHLNTVKWYLALCYSQFGTPSGIDNAKKLLNELAADPDSGYYKEALGYLKFL